MASYAECGFNGSVEIITGMKTDSTQEEREAIAAITPMGRIAYAIDIAHVALFFVQENLLVTGQKRILTDAQTWFDAVAAARKPAVTI